MSDGYIRELTSFQDILLSFIYLDDFCSNIERVNIGSVSADEEAPGIRDEAVLLKFRSPMSLTQATYREDGK